MTIIFHQPTLEVDIVGFGLWDIDLLGKIPPHANRNQLPVALRQFQAVSSAQWIGDRIRIHLANPAELWQIRQVSDQLGETLAKFLQVDEVTIEYKDNV